MKQVYKPNSYLECYFWCLCKAFSHEHAARPMQQGTGSIKLWRRQVQQCPGKHVNVKHTLMCGTHECAVSVDAVMQAVLEATVGLLHATQFNVLSICCVCYAARNQLQASSCNCPLHAAQLNVL